MGPLGQSHLAQGEKRLVGKGVNSSWSRQGLRREGVDKQRRKGPHTCQAAQDGFQNLASTDMQTWKSTGWPWPRATL